jgi:glycosyltransferase involved in cell wall biosynthesis
MKKIAILCPVYNEEKTIGLFYKEIQPVIESLKESYSVDLVFLNNASTDNTLAEIDAVRQKWQQTYVITMSSNVGYQRSLDCGLRNTFADIYSIIDVDCEDPPGMIMQFVEEHEKGFDVVYGERVDRPEPGIIKGMRKAFYRVLQLLADDEIILDMAEFSLFTREVRDAIIQENTSFPFIRSSISRVGFKRKGIPFKRQKRIAGKSHYNLLGMAYFGMAGILAASTLLLRIPILTFPLWLLSMIVTGWIFAATGAGWAGLLCFLFFAAYIGFTLASIAMYLARTYKNNLLRPSAYIRRADSILQPEAAKRLEST